MQEVPILSDFIGEPAGTRTQDPVIKSRGARANLGPFDGGFSQLCALYGDVVWGLFRTAYSLPSAMTSATVSANRTNTDATLGGMRW